jgi:hypothetical protein
MAMRRLSLLFILALTGGLAAPALGADPDHGSVRPPAGSAKIGAKITWAGEHYLVGANTDFVCDETHPCDMFHLEALAPAGYWLGRGGGVTVQISGYDENQDFDMFVFRENADGTLGSRVASSAGPRGQHERATIPKALGSYVVVVYPFAVANSGYEGEAFFELKPLRRPPPLVTDPPGLPTPRASHDKYVSHSEPTIAMNPLDHDNLVAGSKMYTNLPAYRFKIGTYYSTDGGRTWTDNGLLPGYPNDEENYITSDISMAFDDEGNAYAFVLDSGLDHSGMNVHISRDGGKTWSEPITVHRYSYTNTPADGLASVFDDKNWIVVDNSGEEGDGAVGTIYTCWNADVFAPAVAVGEIVVSRSTDGGQTWGPPVPVHGPPKLAGPVPGDDVIGCQVVVGPQGELYVFWMDYANEQVRFVKSTDHGVSFSLPAVVSDVAFPRRLPNTEFRNPLFPSAGVGPDGVVSVVWGDGRFGRDHDEDIAFSRSTDGGSTWSQPTRVNDDNGAGDQFQPWLAVTPSGQIDVFFFDRRHDPSNTYIDAYVARSSDGATWTNVRVTPALWDPFINPPISGSGAFIGDYQGIVADDDAAIPFWNDTRTGKWQEVYSARVPNTKRYGGPRPDAQVLATRKPAPAPLPATGVGSSALGPFLLALAVVLGAFSRRRAPR